MIETIVIALFWLVAGYLALLGLARFCEICGKAWADAKDAFK